MGSPALLSLFSSTPSSLLLLFTHHFRVRLGHAAHLAPAGDVLLKECFLAEEKEQERRRRKETSEAWMHEVQTSLREILGLSTLFLRRTLRRRTAGAHAYLVGHDGEKRRRVQPAREAPALLSSFREASGAFFFLVLCFDLRRRHRLLHFFFLFSSCPLFRERQRLFASSRALSFSPRENPISA